MSNTTSAIFRFHVHPKVPDSVRTAVRQITGRESIPPAVVQEILLPVAVQLLSLIQQAFIQKSRGLTGSDGITWQPLKPATIAQRRTTRAELRSFGITGRRERGLLTPDENRRWKGIFGSRLAHFLAIGMDIGAAKARAAQIAWATLKASGAKTKLAMLGSRKVDIGRDTGRLLNSLTPGIVGTARGEQLIRIDPGSVTVGTVVPYAERFHHLRKLWPDSLPQTWADTLAKVFARSLVKYLATKTTKR